MRDQGKTIGGTQSVSRALTLLKLIASAHPQGVTLTEIISATELERATAHRIASSLVEAGFVQRDAAKSYRLGIESMQVGLTAMTRVPLLDAIQAGLQSIARQTEDTVYLVVRNGDYGHTLHREEGAYPIKSFTSLVGGTRLLGLGTASQALMAQLPADQITQIHQRHRVDYEAEGLSLLRLIELQRRTRKMGHSLTEDLITPGVVAVGKAFKVTETSLAAISVTALKQRMGGDRPQWVADVIAQAVEQAGFAPIRPDPVEVPAAASAR